MALIASEGMRRNIRAPAAFVEAKRAANGAISSLLDGHCDYLNFRSQFFEFGIRSGKGILLQARPFSQERVFSRLADVLPKGGGIGAIINREEGTLSIYSTVRSHAPDGVLSAVVWQIVRTNPHYWLPSKSDEAQVQISNSGCGESVFGSTHLLNETDHKVSCMLADNNYAIAFLPSAFASICGSGARFTHAASIPPAGCSRGFKDAGYVAEIAIFYANPQSRAFSKNQSGLSECGAALSHAGIDVRNFPAAVVASFRQPETPILTVLLVIRAYMAILSITRVSAEMWAGLIRGPSD